MAVAVETLQNDLGGACHSFPIISLVDRRKKPRRKQWCLVRATEIMLYNVTSRSTGRFAAHLASMSMENGILCASRAAVEHGTLKEDELDAGSSRVVS